ncbi:MAG: 2-C-methyl-D-erythritol 2,4-cyclodiphosphate synthase [Calditrichaeota bacterium]|nr:2-C-methyl-D-erythritol 2,4-cyclodiphosphate synthase [Calditrichota bacterium]
MLRVGYGVDMLRLVEGRPLVLGGSEIPSDRGLDGPAQGDVLIRATIDAFLGACAHCDPGPAPVGPEDELPPLEALNRVTQRARYLNYSVVNLDSTLLIGRPRVSRFLDKMRTNIADALHCDPLQISIKERSPEGIGPAGRGESVEARVVILLATKADN